MHRSLVALVLVGSGLSTPAAVAQEADALDVFLDCNTFFCDFDHFRRQIPYVNWVRNREDADVHILVTAQQTGGGGWEFTFAFIGAEAGGRVDTLTHVSDRDETRDEVRDDLARVLKVGLTPFVARTPVLERLDVTYRAPAAADPAAATPADDPWNFWVFTLRVRGSLNGEQQQRFFSGGGTASANRTTEALKLTFSLNGNHSRSEFDIVDSAAGLDTTIVSTRTSYSLSHRAVWSTGAHWSVGYRTSASSSTFLNQTLAVRAGPAVEYNIYPYAESTRRQLTILYTAGIAGFEYDEITIFDRTSEVRPTHNLEIGLSVQQPWGSVGTSLDFSQFLHDLAKHRVDLFASVNLRIVRGLDFNMFGSVARIKDQLFLPRTGLTPEEILLRQRQLGTNFRYNINAGLTYRFGSRFNNVVNPRMGGGGPRIFFF